MGMKYLWEQDVERPDFPALEGDMDTDVLIVGGGMAGVLCAALLQEAGVDYVLAEGGRIGGGITKGTTAVVTAQHDVLYQDLIKKRGRGVAKGYLKANLWAVERFRAMAKHIPCDFEEAPSVMYDRRDGKTMEGEVQAVRSLGFPAEFAQTTPLPFRVAGAVCYPGMAQFHPLKFLCGVAKGLHILEHTFVERLEGTVAHTDRGRIRARRVIVATHFPFLNSRGLYFMKLYQKRSFVLALEKGPELGCTLVDHGEKGMYFRNYQNLLLVGGGDHRTGRQGGGFEAVRAFAERVFPGAIERYAWANQDCMSLDEVPYIGRYSPALPEVFVATGFNEWGMTTSMVAAKLLTELVTKGESRFAGVFAPDRSMLTPQLLANMGATAVDFATPTTKRCSHMGCALKWNKAEHSWDCPCHGSRFDGAGRVIDNPAMKPGHVN